MVCMPMPKGHSQDRPSSTRGQSQHVEAKSKPSRVATYVTAPPSGEKLSVTMRTTNDLLHEDGGKRWKCVGEGDNEEGEMDGFWSQPRAGVFVTILSLSTASVSLPLTHALKIFAVFLSYCLKARFWLSSELYNTNSHLRVAARLISIVH